MKKYCLFLCCFIFCLFLPAFANARPVLVSGKTDTGMVRDHNEDSLIILDDQNVYVVADGMGGHAAGEVASAMAIEAVKDIVTTPLFDAFDEILPFTRTSFVFGAFFEANRRVLQESIANPARRGMGTTMVAIVLHHETADFINLGDSRAYMIRDNKISQVSHDHSLWQELIDRGELKTPEEIENFPYKNIITQAIGTRPELAPDIFTVPMAKGDIYILCSDGLTNELTDDEIMKIILSHGDDLDKATDELVLKAKVNGGRDNITVLLVKI